MFRSSQRVSWELLSDSVKGGFARQKGREGVNPSPRDGGIEALRHCWKEDVSKPPVAQRAGGILRDLHVFPVELAKNL